MRKLLAAFLAVLMVFSVLPVVVFAEGEEEATVPYGEEDAMYVDTNVDSTWQLIGPDNTVQVIGEGGAYEGAYISKYANSRAAGFIFEISGLKEATTTRISYTSFKANVDSKEGTTIHTGQVGSGRDTIAVQTDITNGVYMLSRYPQEWCQWDGMAFVRKLNDIGIKTDVACRIRILGIVEITRNDNESVTVISSLTYNDADGAELGTTVTEYATGDTNSWQAPKCLPLSPIDEKYAQADYSEGDCNYLFDGWQDEDGNPVVAAYGTATLRPIFREKNKDDITVTFLDEYGVALATVDVAKGETFDFPYDAPDKASDVHFSYTFDGWFTEDDEPFRVGKDTSDSDITLQAKYSSDLRQRVRINISKSELNAGDEFTLTLELNRPDITVAGDLEPITEGVITLTYPSYYDIEGGEAGIVEIPFTDVAEDGTVANLTLTAPKGYYGPVSFSAEGRAQSDSAEVAVLSGSVSATVGGMPEGMYLSTEDAEWVSLPTDESGLSATKLWEGNVSFSGAGGVTFVINAKGVETPIEAGMMRIEHSHVGNDNINNMIWEYAYSDGWIKTDDGDVALRLVIPEDGLYYVYLSRKVLGMTYDKSNLIDSVNSFIVFGKGNAALAGGQIPTNTNENAQLQLVGIIADNLQPTVTFRDSEGNVLYTVQHKYTDLTNNNGVMADRPTSNHYVKGALISADDVFAQAGLELPVKESDIPEVEYVFDGWQDADGNKIDGVYMNCDLYPHFKIVDHRTQYNVVFKNYDGTVLYETVVPEGEVPAYDDKLGVPKKPSTETSSYVFLGWDPEITATPLTPEVADGATAPEAIEYTAKYEETVRTYDVIYYDERGKNILYEDMHLSFGSASVCDIIPTKDADIKYNYTFEKWVTLDDEDVDLGNVTTDLALKPVFTVALNKYTVTFMNGGEKVGESSVEYGKAAVAPTVTKDPIENYRFEFKEWVDEQGEAVALDSVKANMTVYASFDQIFAPKFDDINLKSWYAPAVEYVIVNGIMNGMGEGFEPGTNMSRAMVVTVLYRYTDAPEAGGKEVSFTDVKAGEWYTEAIDWAASNEIVNGRGNGIFDPNGNVSRQEFAAILYRYADKINDEYVGFGKSTIAGFADKGEIDAWAVNPIKWAYATESDMDSTAPGVVFYEKTQYVNGKGTLNGKPLMAPKANATRAEVATMLYRYMTGVRLTKEEAGV